MITSRTIFPSVNGLGLIALIAMVSYMVVNLPWISDIGLSALIIAIILGIGLGNTWHYPQTWAPGIQFAAKRLLRTAIILYGFRVSFQQIASVGISALILDIFVVTATLFLGYIIGKKIFKLDQ